jgi:hypothetical protein
MGWFKNPDMIDRRTHREPQRALMVVVRISIDAMHRNIETIRPFKKSKPLKIDRHNPARPEGGKSDPLDRGIRSENSEPIEPVNSDTENYFTDRLAYRIGDLDTNRVGGVKKEVAFPVLIE